MKSTLAAVLVAGTAVLAGCSSYPTSYSSPTYSSYDTSYSTTYGTIDSITVTRGASSGLGAGAVVGGVVGGLVGSQVGSGSGRTAATAAGAIAGAVAGNEIQKNRNERDMYQISVRMDNGDYRTVVQDSVADLRVGNRVRVVDGRVYRY
ncbi:glycine zipper 2TM domain-containing protein [Pseudoduganella sp. GCM10020061]|uniref:glycine zipper 2TM domain-containing protein n=1 Tax=Pseudoduganella sp. GCM10020061 TaxID=3317345 RepID=UPI00362F6A92